MQNVKLKKSLRTIEKESEVEEKYLEKDELNLVLKEIKDLPKST